MCWFGFGFQLNWSDHTHGQELENILKISRKAAYDHLPQAKTFLEENRMKVEQLTESVNKGSEQLEVIKDNLPGDTTAKISAWKITLPRKTYDTRPDAV